MTSTSLRALLATLVVGLPAVAAAQPTPTFTYGKADEVKDVKAVEWTAKTEAGLVVTSGNSKSTTGTITASATRKEAKNKFSADLNGTYARASSRSASDANGDGFITADEIVEKSATSAKNAALKLRYDRFLTDANSLYAAALAAIDKPAGKTFAGGGQLGYSRQLFKNDHNEILAEVGYDFSYERLLDGSSTSIHSARIFTGYKAKVSDTSSAEASLEALFNVNTLNTGGREAGPFEDTRVNGVLGATTNLTKHISLGLSFNAKLDNFPAPLPAFGTPYAAGFAPAADKLDTTSKATLIINFL